MAVKVLKESQESERAYAISRMLEQVEDAIELLNNAGSVIGEDPKLEKAVREMYNASDYIIEALN